MRARPTPFIEPAMPTLVETTPSGGEWIHEVKQDGYRTLMVRTAQEVRAFTRNGHDWTSKYLPVCAAVAEPPCLAAILDGEMIVTDDAGRSDYHALRSAITKAPERLVFVAFDLLNLDGMDLRAEPVEERRRLLAELLAGADPGKLVFSQTIEGDGPEVFGAAEKLGLEGIVSKRLGSRYRSGRVDSWVKTKSFTVSELDIIGFEKTRTGAPAALLAEQTLEGLFYKGQAFITLPQPIRDEMWTYSERHPLKVAPIKEMRRRRGVTWVQPGLSASVKHLRGEEMLRHATLTGLKMEGVDVADIVEAAAAVNWRAA